MDSFYFFIEATKKHFSLPEFHIQTNLQNLINNHTSVDDANIQDDVCPVDDTWFALAEGL